MRLASLLTCVNIFAISAAQNGWIRSASGASHNKAVVCTTFSVPSISVYSDLDLNLCSHLVYVDKSFYASKGNSGWHFRFIIVSVIVSLLLRFFSFHFVSFHFMFEKRQKFLSNKNRLKFFWFVSIKRVIKIQFKKSPKMFFEFWTFLNDIVSLIDLIFYVHAKIRGIQRIFRLIIVNLVPFEENIHIWRWPFIQILIKKLNLKFVTKSFQNCLKDLFFESI